MISAQDQLVLNKLENLVQTERRITLAIIELIREVDEKRIYLGLGFASLFEMLTRKFGYSAGSAQRRIDSARLLKEVPEIKKGLGSGELSVSQVAMVAKGFRQLAKQTP